MFFPYSYLIEPSTTIAKKAKNQPSPHTSRLPPAPFSSKTPSPPDSTALDKSIPRTMSQNLHRFDKPTPPRSRNPKPPPQPYFRSKPTHAQDLATSPPSTTSTVRPYNRRNPRHTNQSRQKTVLSFQNSESQRTTREPNASSYFSTKRAYSRIPLGDLPMRRANTHTHARGRARREGLHAGGSLLCAIDSYARTLFWTRVCYVRVWRRIQ